MTVIELPDEQAALIAKVAAATCPVSE